MMNKLKELYHDIRDFPALVASVILIVAMVAFFGYVFYLMDNVSSKQEDKALGEITGSLEQKAGKAEKETGNTEAGNDRPEEENEAAEDKVVLEENNIKVLANGDFTDFEVWNGGAVAGEIRENRRSQVNIFRTIGNNVYLGVENNGIGGYILFGGPYEIYKLDLKENSLNKLFDRDLFVSDISRDERKLVSVESFYVEDEIYNYLNVYDLADYKSKSYQVPKEYKTAGNAFFSKDGKKLVYEAAVNNPDNEVFAMFVVDLATGAQKLIGGQDSYGKAKKWAENN